MLQQKARQRTQRCGEMLRCTQKPISLHSGLHYGPEKATQIINACCALHNMCIQYKCYADTEASEVGLESTFDEDGGGDAVDSRAVAIRRSIAINL